MALGARAVAPGQAAGLLNTEAAPCHRDRAAPEASLSQSTDAMLPDHAYHLRRHGPVRSAVLLVMSAPAAAAYRRHVP